jgi:hypothetical protein
MNSHPCPICSWAILGNKWLCQHCWDSLPKEEQRQINARFSGTAEDYLAVEAALDSLAVKRLHTTRSRT